MISGDDAGPDPYNNGKRDMPDWASTLLVILLSVGFFATLILCIRWPRIYHPAQEYVYKPWRVELMEGRLKRAQEAERKRAQMAERKNETIKTKKQGLFDIEKGMTLPAKAHPVHVRREAVNLWPRIAAAPEKSQESSSSKNTKRTPELAYIRDNNLGNKAHCVSGLKHIAAGQTIEDLPANDTQNDGMSKSTSLPPNHTMNVNPSE